MISDQQLSAIKMPPHSIEAEQSVLGGLMLDNKAWDDVAERISEADFYRSEHAIIFAAIESLANKQMPFDVLTLSEDLKQHGKLSQARGEAYLFELAKNTPSAANILAYTDIVRERSVLRQLAAAANQIAESAFRPSGLSVTDLLDQAEQKVFSIGEQTHKQGDGPQNINSIMAKTLEKIDALYEAKGAITGLTTGFNDLDAMTSGMQPADLIIVAGRPSMGKTTFAMNIAENAALELARKKDDRAVIIFSLEMPSEAIVMRMFSSMGRISQQNIRTGRLTDQDWSSLTSTISLFSDTNLFIDDSAGLTPTELRARVRRIAKETGGVALIVVDYLQLMRVPGLSDNRVAEVSEISRSLKAIAKEFKTPLIAGSQLNRSLEQRQDKRPIMADLRECVTGDTLVNLADGKRVPIAQLIDQEVDVLAIDENKKIVTARCEKIWKVGTKQTYKITFASGKILRATKEHRIMAFKGWATVENLNIGDRIATARILPEPVICNKWDEHQLILLAHMIGDGSYLTHQPMRYTTSNEENSLVVQQAATIAFGALVKRTKQIGSWHQLIISGDGTRWKPAGINKWLRELKIYNQRSHEKHVPDEIFTLSNAQIALFLKHLWATDGCIFVKDVNKRGADVIQYSTNSLRLAKDVVALLLRFGIIARIKKTQKATYRQGYLISITGLDQQKKFLNEIGGFGPRTVQAEMLLKKIANKKANTNIDTIPIAVFDEVKLAMNARGISQRAMANLRGTSYGGTSHFKFDPSRTVLNHYADLLGSDVLKNHANNDIFWDKIVNITLDVEEDVYDLTVPGYESWLADGIVSHNSGAIEQDADLIICLYRDEVYNESAEKNVAEILIRKHRNGPIGDICLTFRGELSRFDNYQSEGRYDSSGHPL